MKKKKIIFATLIVLLITIFVPNFVFAEYSYTVTFDMQGHGTQVNGYGVNSGMSLNKPNDPSENGYLFGGWYKQAECTTAWNFASDEVAGNTTLYAKWTPAFTASFDMQGHGTQIDPQIIASGEKVNKPNNPSDTGYSFGGWYKEAACSNAWDFNTDTVSANTTLYAKWTPTFTASFDMQGHGTQIDPQMVVSGSKANKPSDPSDNDYLFGGWYKEAACSNAWDFDTDTVSANTTLYAKWTQITVTFNSDGGTTIDPQTIAKGSVATKPKTPVKDGYTFVAWYDNTTSWDFATPITADKTLTAKWILQSATYNVTGTSVTNKKFVKGSGTDYSITVDAVYSNFKYLTVDGDLVDPTNYTVASGSTIVTLKTSYLNTLSAGTHNVRLNYTDGSNAGKADSTIIIENAPQSSTRSYKPVNTGIESSNNGTLKLISLVPILGITTVIAIKKKKH